MDVRLIGATNADLLDLADNNRFKRDLLDRLTFEVLFLPPLRERKGDILFLADHFAGRMAFELAWEETPVFSDEAGGMLENYAWPGNIRELKNVVERAVYRSDSYIITDIDFNPFRSPYATPTIEKASPEPNKEKVATISRADLQAIAEQKMPDLNANDIDAAMKIIAGTARSMGVEVEGGQV